MIYRLQGTIDQLEGSLAIITVQDVGYGVMIPHPEQYAVGDTVSLQIAWHWNQEHGPQLFGFATEEERSLFQLIISCSGWGPKLALSLLHQTTAADCAAAIMGGDQATLSSFKGIGSKKAEALIMHLRNKVDKINFTSGNNAATHSAQKIKDLSDALQALRYSSSEIAVALRAIRERGDLQTTPFDQLLRIALRHVTTALP